MQVSYSFIKKLDVNHMEDTPKDTEEKVDQFACSESGSEYVPSSKSTSSESSFEIPLQNSITAKSFAVEVSAILAHEKYNKYSKRVKCFISYFFEVTN